MSAKLIILFCLVIFSSCISGLLYPRESPYREIKELNGLWHFRADDSVDRNAGFAEKWYLKPLSKSGDTILMPVPSSYNDITQNDSLRLFVGWVWYDRQVWIPKSWLDGKTRILLRFESAHYNTIAWVNGEMVSNHSGGHLPFEGDITTLVKWDSPNTFTVAVNNTLTPHTIPPGFLSYQYGHVSQQVQMDFFNYAGIQRPVKLYATPMGIHIDDITVTTTILSNNSAKVDYMLKISGSFTSNVTCDIQLMGGGNGGDGLNDEEEMVSQNTEVVYCKNTGLCVFSQSYLIVDDPSLWWPWTMSDSPGFLYAFQVNVSACDSKGNMATDLYRQPIGIRTVGLEGDKFMINGKQFYFQGFGKHEDADIRGKGLDYPILMKDMNLLKWLGANSFRTSHYPYAEEMMDLCDKFGIVVVDETPAVGLVKAENFADETLKHHLIVLEELITRDKNRPAVVMWSLANEPKSDLPQAQPYFKALADKAHSLDPTRPITFACNMGYNTDKASQYMDVISINRYYGWYLVPGILDSIPQELSQELDSWYATHKKPMLITEYGAGAVAGMHKDPPVMYSEEYQAVLLTKFFPTFDEYRKSFLVGELLWNFADFETAQIVGRVDGNKKGVLTRQRQPKMAAMVIRERYHALAKGKNYCERHSFIESNEKYC